MKTTMDRGGRVMLPARVRAAMALRPGQRFTVREVAEDRIELILEETPVRLEMGEDGLPVLVEDEPGDPITLEQTLDEIQAAREERLDQLSQSRSE